MMRCSRIMVRMAAIAAFLGILALAGCMLFQPKVVVDFEATPTSGATPHLVDFTPVVEGTVISYEWDFGDGQTSDQPAPAHIYRTAGAFTVSLTVQLADGESVDVVKEELIEVALRVGKEAPPGPLVWLDQDARKIHSGPRFGGEVSTVVTVSGYSDPQQIAVADGVVYWTCWQGTVERANLDGTGHETILDRDAELLGMAVDTVNDKVYWVEEPRLDYSGLGGSPGSPARIWRASLNGSGKTVWASKEEWAYRSYIPDLLAIDSVNGRLYWYERKHDPGGIIVPMAQDERSIHWSNLSTFADHAAFTQLPKIGAIALDVGLNAGAHYVYWTEPANDSVRFGYVGETYQSTGLWLSAEAPRALTIDAYEGKIYWSSSDGIHRANLSDGSDEELIYPGVQADDLALDL